MPTITANASEETVKAARRAALDADKSLRDWAGEVIAAKVKPAKPTKPKTKKKAS